MIYYMQPPTEMSIDWTDNKMDLQIYMQSVEQFIDDLLTDNSDMFENVSKIFVLLHCFRV